MSQQGLSLLLLVTLSATNENAKLRLKGERASIVFGPNDELAATWAVQNASSLAISGTLHANDFETAAGSFSELLAENLALRRNLSVLALQVESLQAAAAALAEALLHGGKSLSDCVAARGAPTPVAGTSALICRFVAPPDEHAVCPTGWLQYQAFRATEGCSVVDSRMPSYQSAAQVPTDYCGVVRVNSASVMKGGGGTHTFTIASAPFADGALQDEYSVVPTFFPVPEFEGSTWVCGGGCSACVQRWDAGANRYVDDGCTNCHWGQPPWGCRGSYSPHGALIVKARISEIGCY